MRRLTFSLLLVVVALLVATTAQAQTKLTNPWYSTDNLSISTGANYQWWKAADGAPQLNVKKEWTVGVYNAWTLTEHIDAIGTIEYGTDTKLWQFKLGGRWVLKAPR